MSNHEKTVRDFLDMLMTRKSVEELDAFYHPAVEQVEFPNAVTKTTATRSLSALKEAAQKGNHILTKEAYEIKNLLSVGETVVLECTWRGTLAIPLGNIPVGGQMVAHFAQIFEFKEGKIFRQRNYDCFEPFNE